ncbi:uncharacterized protein K444DRAFT_614798, partial [Hyaloscypha bicolor E]
MISVECPSHPQKLTSHSQGPCKQAMVIYIPEYTPYLYIASFPTTLLFRTVSHLITFQITTTAYALCSKGGSAGGGVKRGRKLSLQGRGEHRFVAVVIRTVS